MKTKIEIIFGFLGSGKTSFINSMLTKLHDEIIVIIQNEFGHAKINSSLIDKASNLKIITIEKDSKEEINYIYIEKILETYSPQKIFIEANSFNNPSTITNLFKNTDLEKYCLIDNIITLIDAENFNLYLSNMNYLITSQISNSEKIIITNIQSINKNSIEYKNIRSFIKSIKDNVDIIEYENVQDDKKESFEETDMENLNFNPLFFMAITILLFGAFSIISFSNIISSQYICNFFISFKSMLIKELTFLLLGSFISSILHIFISKDILFKIFVRNTFISCIISGFAGMFFPVCSCGSILASKVFIRKDLPKAACITFLLSSQILNPIVLISAASTFHNMKSVVLCYGACGFIISVIIGFMMSFFIKDNENILNKDSYPCRCGFCSNQSSYYGNIVDVFKALFIHTENEFFNNLKFIITGIFLNSIFHSSLYLNNINIPKDNETSLILMILLSFILSGCSCDSAVIGKGLMQYFSINSILIFLICSPMINIKNLILLFGNFKVRFVLKLLFLVLIISLSILINIDLSYTDNLLEGYIYGSIK